MKIHSVELKGNYGSNFTACGRTYLSCLEISTNKKKVTCKNCKKTKLFRGIK